MDVEWTPVEGDPTAEFDPKAWAARAPARGTLTFGYASCELTTHARLLSSEIEPVQSLGTS